MNVTLTKDRLMALLRGAYEDGFEDGTLAPDPDDPHLINQSSTEQDWLESVTYDNATQDLKAYKGGLF